MDRTERSGARMANEGDYTDRAIKDQRRTYDRVIGMFKWLIILVAFILLGLLVFFR